MSGLLARAKVNLALHVTGRRADGYHLLDTLVVFPPVGDRLSARQAERFSLSLTGPFAARLAGEDPDDNLVLRAARAVFALAGRENGLAFTLEKALPIAAGLGGGSADAAVAMALAADACGLDPADPRLAGLALSLGADVPMCRDGRPLRAGGIGETLRPLAGLPPLGILLANPGVPVPTPAVFRQLASTRGAQADADGLPQADPPTDGDGFLAYLRACRNDLQAAAVAIAPAVGDTLSALAALDGVRLTRMSGSGATCLALFDDAVAAEAARQRLAADRPGWWTAAAPLA